MRTVVNDRPLALVGRKHPALHEPVESVGEWDDRTRLLARRMAATLSRVRGYAIAAPQVGHRLNLVVHRSGLALIDIEVYASGPLETQLEGCLTLPGRWFAVPRHLRASVVGTDMDGNRSATGVQDIEARCWQHENDHLAGLLLSGRFDEVRHPEKWTA